MNPRKIVGWISFPGYGKESLVKKFLAMISLRNVLLLFEHDPFACEIAGRCMMAKPVSGSPADSVCEFSVNRMAIDGNVPDDHVYGRFAVVDIVSHLPYLSLDHSAEGVILCGQVSAHQSPPCSLPYAMHEVFLHT